MNQKRTFNSGNTLNKSRKNQVVLITGCSSGIGKALSEEFHRCGFRVIATARRLDSIDDLQKKGVSTYSLDVTDKDGINRVIDTILEQEKHIDVLVNNAGYGLMGPAIEIPEEELNQQFQTNVIAPLIIAQKTAPSMKDRGYGVIINIGSISGIATTPFSGAYCASKAALHALSDALRMELAPFGIHVVSVQPGAVKSKFGETAGGITARIIKTGSWYQPIESAIKARAEISQIDALPAEDFSKQLVSAVMTKSPPPAVVRIGKKSLLLPMLKKWLPVKVLDKIFKKKFGLARLERSGVRSPFAGWK